MDTVRADAAISRRKRRIFIAFVLVVPLILLLAGEGVLRLYGYGGHPPVVREVGRTVSGTVVITDPAGAAGYFFTNRSKAGRFNESTFITPKPQGTVRILFAGESAIQGFPQPPPFSAGAFLEAMLSEVWPQRRIEVLNLGTTAVASFPVLETLTSALAYEPDLAVIYTGHNEFFGAYGVTSLHSAGRTPAAMRWNHRLRSLGLVQFLGSFSRTEAPAGDKTLMEVMVAQGFTAPGEPVRDAAARNLHDHIAEMIRRCQARDIPVVVCTLASNERDLAPIGTDDLGRIPDGDRGRFVALLAEGQRLSLSDPAAAADALESAVALAPNHANALFALGRARFALGEHTSAREHIQRALDLDPMPWRAPDQSIQAIRRATKESAALLCDIRDAFREASSGGCIGWELMDDHVHPSLEGQYVLARALVATLRGMPGDLNVPAAAYDALPGFQELVGRMGDNPYDRYAVAHTLRVVFDVPFMRATNADGYERFNRQCEKLEASMSPGVRQVVREWQKPTTHKGAKRPISGMVGRELVKENRHAEAERLFRVAQKCVPLYSAWNFEYVYFMLACREKLAGALDDADQRIADAALQRADFLLSNREGSSGQVERYAGRLHQLCGRHGQAVPYLRRARAKLTGMDLVANDMALVEAYVKTGAVADARALAEQGILHSGQHTETYRQMLAGIPTR